MSIKLIGAALIIAACGGIGFSITAQHRKEERMLHKVIRILDYMECELQYRLTPLPLLCAQAARESAGLLQHVFTDFAQEMDNQITPDVSLCMEVALSRHNAVPEITRSCLRELGKSLGKFDLQGQLKGLDGVRSSCGRKLKELEENKEVRLRSYQTLGLCAGAALAILLI